VRAIRLGSTLVRAARRKPDRLLKRIIGLTAAGALIVGTVGAAGASANAPARAKRCANTGTYVKPGQTTPVGNSGKNNPGKLFKERRGKHDADQERHTGETASIGGLVATVTGAPFEQSVGDGRSERRKSAGYVKVLVKVCNRNRDTKYVSPLEWRLQTPSGTRLWLFLGTRFHTFRWGPLVGGGEQAGDIYFEVGPQRGDFYVVFKPFMSDPFGDERGIWKVTI
jgi:Domain of unknown function (DUF4352)